MEEKVPEPSKGYQKKVKQEAKPAAPKPKRDPAEYASPLAKKWPQFLEALEAGNAEVVRKMIDEGINVNVLRAGVTPLMVAASRGYREIVEALMQAGANVNERTDEGWTALHKAAGDQAGTAVIELLMDSGVDSEAKNKEGKTALQLAEEKGHREIVRVIKKRRQQQRRDAEEWEEFLQSPEGRPYREAGRLESLEWVFRIWWLPPVVLGAVGLITGALFHAALIAGISGAAGGLAAGLFLFLWEKKLRAYLEAFSPLPSLNIHLLREKRRAGEPITVPKSEKPKITEKSADDPGKEPAEESAVGLPRPDSSSTAVFEPAEEDRPPETFRPKSPKRPLRFNRKLAVSVLIFLLLAGAGAGITAYRDSLVRLYYAKKLGFKGIPFTGQAFLEQVAGDNGETVDLFVRAGMRGDVSNEKGQTALMVAVTKGSGAMLNRIIGLKGTDLNHVDKDGNTALVMAAQQGSMGLVRTLVERGANVNAFDGSSSALEAAAGAPFFGNNHVKVLRYLLGKGADPNRRDKRGGFALLLATDEGRIEAARALIENGAKVNDVDSLGNYPLMKAACRGYGDLIGLFVDNGADLKMTSADGETPLICAVQNGMADAVSLLLAKGAEINARTGNGDSALTVATRTGDVGLAKLLLEAGADPGNAYLPGQFTQLRGKTVIVKMNKRRMADVLQRLRGAASSDGYTLNADTGGSRLVTVRLKKPWNRALMEVAKKNNLLLVVKEREVSCLPYDPKKAGHRQR